MKQRFIVLMFMLLGVGAPAYGQIPGININLGARAGAFMPMSALVEDALGEVKLKNGLGIGASIELDLPLSPINVRANVEAAMNAKVEEDGVETGDEVDVIAFTGDLVFRPLPRIVVVQPYFLAGAGIKKYSFGTGFEDENDFTGHLGAGVDFKLGPLAVLVEANDYISSFKIGDAGESKLQNDVFIAVGFRIGML
jgi:hypothetical protein